MSKREVRKNLSVTPSGRWEKLVFGLPGMWKKKKTGRMRKKEARQPKTLSVRLNDTTPPP